MDLNAVAIVDYGMGNLASVANMLKKLGRNGVIANEAEVIAASSKIILPGVGSFDAGMQALRDRGIDQALRLALQKGATIFGICLGFQLLFEDSEEGGMAGLGILPGKVRKLGGKDPSLRVPHMGWNLVSPTRASILFPDSSVTKPRFYFVHSYYVECASQHDTSATVLYGHEFSAAVERDNVLGVQFHPEKSHRFGLQLFQRLLDA